MKLKLIVFLTLCLFGTLLKGQTIHDFYLYSSDHSVFNPAAAGAENKHVVGIYGTLYEENFGPFTRSSRTGMIAYNGNISPLNSGIGVLGISNRTGSVVTSKAGLSYNYKITLAPKASLRVGLRPVVTKVSTDIPQNPPPGYYIEEKDQFTANLDLGLWLDVSGFYIGATVNNAINKKVYDNPATPTIDEKDPTLFAGRSATLIAGKKIKIPSLLIDPAVAVSIDGPSILSISNNFTLANIFLLGGTYMKMLDYQFHDFSVNAGVSIVNKVQIIGVIYTRGYNMHYFDKSTKFYEGMVRVKI